jgi:hypothetical protein
MVSELDMLLEAEEEKPITRAPWPAKPEESRRKYLAIFDIDMRRLLPKDENTFYSPSTHTWKDGIVFKFPHGVPERGQPCVAVFKLDCRYKYHDFVTGRPRTQGRGMPTGYEIDNKIPYGIRDVIHIYPAEKKPERPEIRYRLVYTQWDTRHTSRGGRSCGSLVDTEDGRIIHKVVGAESSATGNHGAIHVCAVVEGRPVKRTIRISNDTCNYHEHEAVV